jgi:hypothetical protein
MANEVLDAAHFMTLAVNGQGVSQTIAPSAASTADAVHVIFRLHWQIIINGVTDGLHVDAARGDIGSNQHTYATVLYFSQGT